MSFFNLLIIGTILMILFIYLLARYILTERQLCKFKYAFFVSLVILHTTILLPIFSLRPRNALNIRLAAIAMNPLFRLLGIKYRVENSEVLDIDEPCVIVANHQSSIDLIGMMHIWPQHVRYGTVLAKKELIWAGIFGIGSWLAGVEFIDRKNRQQSDTTMRHMINKIKTKSLRLWVFPEGMSILISVQ